MVNIDKKNTPRTISGFVRGVYLDENFAPAFSSSALGVRECVQAYLRVCSGLTCVRLELTCVHLGQTCVRLGLTCVRLGQTCVRLELTSVRLGLTSVHLGL